MALPAAPTRTGDRASSRELLDGEPRYRLDQVWQGLYEQLAEPAEITNLPKALRTRLAERPAAGADAGHRVGQRQRRHGQVPVGARRREPDRDRADALPRPGDRVRQQPGRLRDGVRVLRHRPGRLHPPPHASARSSSRSCGRRDGPRDVGRRRQQRRVHGHGRAAGQRRRGVGRASSGSTATSGCRPATSRSRPSASSRASARSPSGRCRSTSPSRSTPPTTRCATSSCRSTGATRSTIWSRRAPTTSR